MATTFFSETTPAIFEHIVKEVPLGLVTCNEEGGILSINPFLQKIMQMEAIGSFQYLKIIKVCMCVCIDTTVSGLLHLSYDKFSKYMNISKLA